jgi:hypothetical protein
MFTVHANATGRLLHPLQYGMYPGKLFFHIYDIYQFAGRGAAFVVVALFLLRVQYRTWYEYMVSYTYIHDDS